MPCQLLGERVGDGHGVNQHHHEEGEEIEAGDQITDFLAVVVINRAGDPAPGRYWRRE
jgi:hypothetical protein